MAYDITYYYSEPTISETIIECGIYGALQGYVEADGEYDHSAVLDGMKEHAIFTATPASGCEFYRWVYRVGSISNSRQYSDQNPFTYTKGEDIWIYAEGQPKNPVESITARHYYGSTSMYIDVVGDYTIENYRYYVTDEYGDIHGASVSKGYNYATNTLVLIVKNLTPRFDYWNNFTIDYTDQYTFTMSFGVMMNSALSVEINDLRLVSRLNGQCTLSWTKPDDRASKYVYDYYIYDYDRSEYAKISTFTTSDTNVQHTFSTAGYGRSVLACIDATPVDVSGTRYTDSIIDINSISFISVPPKPTVEITSTSNNTITGTWGLTNEFYQPKKYGYLSKFKVYIDLYQCGETLPIQQYYKTGLTTGSFTFTGLNKGSYEIKATSVIEDDDSNIWSIGYDDDGSVNNISYRYIYSQIVTVLDSTAIQPWSWEKSNGEASDIQTSKAHTAIMNKGYIGDFSYLVWNDLVDKTYEAAGNVWHTYNSETGVTYPTYGNTKMKTEDSNDRYLTAERFNALRFNIGSLEATGLTDKRRGDVVYGKYFTMLTNSLNKYINKKNKGEII